MNVEPMLLEVCRRTIDSDYLLLRRRRAQWNGTARAVSEHDTAHLFGSLVEAFSFQGIADARASAYMDQHGRVTYDDVARGLGSCAACPKLATYWHYRDCGYTKRARVCAEPDLLKRCPVPRHDLRNGRLNQMAYALFLFLRDVCSGDLVGWIDGRLVEAASNAGPRRATAMREALLAPMSQVYGVSFKVLAMALAELLLAGDPERTLWVETGASMVAVDTLVHNWLHRTGIARELGREHPYGRFCYEPGGCAEVLGRCSEAIDAQTLCPDGPGYFPRLVQHAVWRFCAEGGLNICNGNRINDRIGCMQLDCPLSVRCAHFPPS